ncbi:MAG: hypothetical protein N2445_05010, partial [Acidobacteria bacterium]|nr:hypothetical protein [Acidobacteriota bacterium]
VVVVNKSGPPPVKPIVPIPKKAINVDQNFSRKVTKDSELLITNTGGLNIHPSKIRDLKDGRATIDDIRQTISEPPVLAKKKIMPTSLDRDDFDITPAKNRDLPSPNAPNRSPDAGNQIDNPTKRTSPAIRTPIGDSDTRFPDVDRREPSRRGYDSDNSISPPAVRDQQTREVPQREIPYRDLPQRETPNSETPKRETPQRDAPQRDNNINRDSPRSNDNDRGGSSSRGGSVSPPPPPPPPSTSGSSSNKSNKHHLSFSNSTKNKVVAFVKNVGKSAGSVVSSKSYSTGSKNNTSAKETKNKRI